MVMEAGRHVIPMRDEERYGAEDRSQIAGLSKGAAVRSARMARFHGLADRAVFARTG